MPPAGPSGCTLPAGIVEQYILHSKVIFVLAIIAAIPEPFGHIGHEPIFVFQGGDQTAKDAVVLGGAGAIVADSAIGLGLLAETILSESVVYRGLNRLGRIFFACSMRSVSNFISSFSISRHLLKRLTTLIISGGQNSAIFFMLY